MTAYEYAVLVYNRACADGMADKQSENAQAVREVASLSHDDDPEPGAFYGLTAPTELD